VTTRVYNDADLAFTIAAHSPWYRTLDETGEPDLARPYDVGFRLAQEGETIAWLYCPRTYFDDVWLIAIVGPEMYEGFNRMFDPFYM
jgi:hypothetical protein